MTTIALPTTLQRTDQPTGSRVGWAIQDMATITWRNLRALTRTPEAVFFSTLQPIMFTLLFVYVFGGAIHTGIAYVDYLMPGIYVQTVAFGAVSTAVGLSEDLNKGLIERFRALPMARSAVLAGRTSADLVRNVFVVVLISAVGFAVGFRIGTNFGLFLCADHGLPGPLPLHLRLVRLRAGLEHARLAAGLRQAPAGDPGRRRGALAHDGGFAHGHRRRVGRVGLVRGAADRAGAPGGAQVPPGRLTRPKPTQSSWPVRRRNSATNPLTGTRTCSVVSRSRTVTASSSSESKSTVTHHGVPTSSWRR